MKKVLKVLNEICGDQGLLESFVKLNDLEDIKNFLKKIDDTITDDEFSEFLHDKFFEFSQVPDDALQSVSGGKMSEKVFSLPVLVLSAVVLTAGAVVLPQYIGNSNSSGASTHHGTTGSLGGKVLTAVKDYLSEGFINAPTECTLLDNMASRVAVFEDTMNYCVRNKEDLSINRDKNNFTSDSSEVIHYNHQEAMKHFSGDGITKTTPAKVWLTNGKSLQSLNAVNARLGIKPQDVKNTAVLNFANYYCPGGGVVSGCRAQEECLCRVTSLYPHLATKKLHDDFYSKHTTSPTNIDQWRDSGIANQAIYTKGVKQIKEDYGIGRVGEYVDGSRFNVITAAAPDFRGHRLTDNEVPKYMDLMKDMWRMILSTAYEHGDRNLVLGALGCGAFENDPKLVSQAFYDVLTENGPGGVNWAYCFDNIILPIYVSPRSGDKKNYEEFKDAYERIYGAKYQMDQTEIALVDIS